MLDFKLLASFLQGLKPDPDARVCYDLFADALVWSDEIPDPHADGMEPFHAADLRGVWRYRTLLMLGQAGDRFREAWQEAEKCFPAWPGFDPNRRGPSWTDTFTRLRDQAMRKWEEDEARGERAVANQQQAGV